MAMGMRGIYDGIINEIIDSGGYDYKKPFVNIDKVWENPKRNERLSTLVAEYIKNYIGLKLLTGIIAVDSIPYPFGPIPLAVSLSSILSLPLGIVKEGDDPISGRHRIYGCCQPEGTLLLYDVVRYGLNAIRVLNFLNSQNINPKIFLTIVSINADLNAFIHSKLIIKNGFEFHKIVMLEEIRNYYNDLMRQNTNG